jgi:hypothetical protein
MLKYNIHIGDIYETLLNHLNFHVDWTRLKAILCIHVPACTYLNTFFIHLSVLEIIKYKVSYEYIFLTFLFGNQSWESRHT